MKNLAKLVGIIVLVAVIGFSMAACDDGNGGGNGDRDTISIIVKNDTGSLIEAEVIVGYVEGETVVSGVGKKNIDANSQATWTLKLKNFFDVVSYIQVSITDTGKSAVITIDNNVGDSVTCTWTGTGLMAP